MDVLIVWLGYPGIIQAIEKLQKKFLIKFTEGTMHVICNSDTNEGGIQVWSQIKISSIFSQYRIQSNSGNEITMFLSSEALLGALRSASSNPSSLTSTIVAGSSSTVGPVARDTSGAGAGAAGGRGGGAGGAIETEEVVMRLTKKNDQAMLTFDISGATRMGRAVHVMHDVRIEVMRPADVARMIEPMCPEPDIHILLPSLQKLRTIVERLRPMSNIMAIRANGNGVLQFGINTDSVKVETEWRECANPKTSEDKQEDDPEHERDPDKLFTVIVSIKSFLKFLNSHVVSTTTIACICQHHCLILYVYIGEVAEAGGVLTFYVPAVIDDS
ncbi:hypothetical protein EST38_g8956 [Candolleomyces aberdarensis]|uniref:Checkpoint protein n=1 Tax=Candolleomyces aberdarensis TaxID=2316362 RepID=A0A4Q2DD05_9AGAR|nr:hypothetical protein EST38_g8956 [Candolleomyces aberdarensis]